MLLALAIFQPRTLVSEFSSRLLHTTGQPLWTSWLAGWKLKKKETTTEKVGATHPVLCFKRPTRARRRSPVSTTRMARTRVTTGTSHLDEKKKSSTLVYILSKRVSINSVIVPQIQQQLFCCNLHSH